MVNFVYGKFNIAPNWDNLDGLRTINQIHDDFIPYKKFIAINYLGDEGRERSAGGRYKPIGLPQINFTLQRVTVPAFKELVVITNNNIYDYPVTIHFPNTVQNVWQTGNAIMVYPDNLGEIFNGAEYEEFVLTFVEIRLI